MRRPPHPEVQAFLDRVRGFGFRAYLAERGTYGFITDAEGSRVLDFGFNDGGRLYGRYDPPSQANGTGWVMDGGPDDLRTTDDVRLALYARAPDWVRRPGQAEQGWKRYSTLADHLAAYQTSSRFYGPRGLAPHDGDHA